MTRPFTKIVIPLALGETLVWAGSFYTFPALLLTWEQQTEWSKGELSGAYTGALLITAVAAPLIGRLIDRDWGKWVLAGATLFGAMMLFLLSQVTALWHFYAVWLGLGVAMAGMLYEPCFSVVTRYLDRERKRTITYITLAAGLAGTISFPANFALVNAIGWRSGVQVIGLVLLLVAMPLLWMGVSAAERFGDAKPEPETAETKFSPTLLRQPVFWLLALGFVAMALNHTVLLTHLLPLLDERGVAEGTAVFAASMIGPMQVAGRLGMIVAERRMASLKIFAGCFLAMGVASLLLFGAAVLPLLLIPFVILQGAGNGVTSILRPVVTAELLGNRNFGVISGLLAIPFIGSVAFAPTIAALIWELGGYDVVIAFAAGAAITGLVVVWRLGTKKL